MKRILFFLFIGILTFQLSAQENFLEGKDSTDYGCSYASFNLGSSTSGISFGNSKRWNGIRFNYRDCGVEEVNGINITFWTPRKNNDSKIKGISLGVAPAGGYLSGITLGIAASVAKYDLKGINLGGLAVVSGGDADGINIGGLAVVAENNLRGINFGGLALVSEGNQYGINIGGLASVAKGEMKGLNFGGLALVSESSMAGINFGGLACVSKEEIKGINLAGLALVAEGNVYGLNQALLAVVSKGTIAGVNFVGYKTEAEEFIGFNVTCGWVEVNNLTGFSVSTYHKINDTQRGLVIGLFNVAENLNGVQLGLINIARNNNGWAKVLPFINAHFD